MIPSLFICSECKEIEEDRTNVATCAECGVGSEYLCSIDLCLDAGGYFLLQLLQFYCYN